jgi:ABC-type sugar transport system ATPase subunit
LALTEKPLPGGEPVTVAVRPESLTLSSDPVPGMNSVEAQVDIGLFVGESVDYHVQMGDLLIRVKGSARSRFRRHDKVYVGIPPEDCTVIAEDGVSSAPLAVDVEGEADSLEQTV